MNTTFTISIGVVILLIFILTLIQRRQRKRFELDILYFTRYEGSDLIHKKMSKQQNFVTAKPVVVQTREKAQKISKHNRYLEYLKQQYMEKINKKKKQPKDDRTYSLFTSTETETSKEPLTARRATTPNSNPKADNRSNQTDVSKRNFAEDINIYIQSIEQKNRVNFNQNIADKLSTAFTPQADFKSKKAIRHPNQDVKSNSTNKIHLEEITLAEITDFRNKKAATAENSRQHNPLNKSAQSIIRGQHERETIDINPAFRSRKSIEAAIDDYYAPNINEITTATNTYIIDIDRKNRRQAFAEKKVISPDEIKNNLLKLRVNRRNINAKNKAKPNQLTTNKVIGTEEIYANLAGTDSPLNRKKMPKEKPRTMVTESIIPEEAKIKGSHGFEVKYAKTEKPTAPISSKFTPSNNYAGKAENLNLSSQNAQLTKTEQLIKEINNPAIAGRPDETIILNNDSLLGDNVDNELTQNNADEQNQASHIRYNQFKEDSKETNKSQAIQSNELITTSFLNYKRPQIILLQSADNTNTHLESKEDIIAKGQLIEDKLAEFRVKVSVTDAYAGPVVTRYDIEPDTGVRGNQVINLEKDLARALGCASIRIVDTIPGKTCMGLELPNTTRKVIRLSEILGSQAFIQSKSKLTLALGHDITGIPIVTDLAKSPHLLVAGTTGSGKSVGINAMILSILFKATPDEVRLIMIDPKMLELSIYEGIPHLLAPVVTDMKLAPNALIWCVNEMEKRYRLMSQLGVRNIIGYNQKIKAAMATGQRISNPFSLTPDNPELLEPLPYIVVIVDEFADLMMTTGKKIEELIARLAQKARAAGIHLILATQRPSVDVITGLIKANIPSRIAFQVSSKIDSRTIIDQMGAENLLGLGDMLFTRGSGFPLRIHGAFVADEEVHRVVEYLKQFGEPDYVDDILSTGVGDDDLFSNSNTQRNNDGENDPLYDEAVNIVLTSKKASISFIQRQLRIGYNRAARLIEQMEDSGIVSPPENNGNRTILMKPTQSID